MSLSAAAVLSTMVLLMRLGPEVRTAVESFLQALLDRDEVKARRAVEAALRAAFVARQRR